MTEKSDEALSSCSSSPSTIYFLEGLFSSDSSTCSDENISVVDGQRSLINMSETNVNWTQAGDTQHLISGYTKNRFPNASGHQLWNASLNPVATETHGLLHPRHPPIADPQDRQEAAKNVPTNILVPYQNHSLLDLQITQYKSAFDGVTSSVADELLSTHVPVPLQTRHTGQHPNQADRTILQQADVQGLFRIRNTWNLMDMQPSFPFSWSSDSVHSSLVANNAVRPSHALLQSFSQKYKSATLCFPCPQDVLLGRGRSVLMHPGNVRLRSLVDKYRKQYETRLVTREDKMAITKMIVDVVKSCKDGEAPGRFLKYFQDLLGWVEIDDESARRKVSHLFRDKPQRRSSLFVSARKRGTEEARKPPARSTKSGQPLELLPDQMGSKGKPNEEQLEPCTKPSKI